MVVNSGLSLWLRVSGLVAGYRSREARDKFMLFARSGVCTPGPDEAADSGRKNE